MEKEGFLEVAIREFARLKTVAERAMSQLDEAEFYDTREGENNCLAVLVKHMAGNMHSRWHDFLTSEGEKLDRNRDQEFELTGEDTRAHLMDRWERGWSLLFSALSPLGTDDVNRIVTIRGEGHTVLQATVRQLTHYAYHVGQIVFLAKQHSGDRWQNLSVPRGMSENFNQEPENYLTEPVRHVPSASGGHLGATDSPSDKDKMQT